MAALWRCSGYLLATCWLLSRRGQQLLAVVTSDLGRVAGPASKWLNPLRLLAKSWSYDGCLYGGAMVRLRCSYGVFMACRWWLEGFMGFEHLGIEGVGTYDSTLT